MTDLSPTMRAALEFAKKHGGELIRSGGGYWGALPERKMGIQSIVTYGTPTVQALVSRGLAEYTEWKDGRNGRFPIRMSVKKEPTNG